MFILLTGSCPLASRCLALPRRSDGSSPPADVYAPTDTDPEGGIIAFLSSAQNALLVVTALVAVALFVWSTWSGRRRSHQEEAEPGPSTLPPKAPPN